jgi:fumarylacetoacetate (FAA) hydrolase family protein
MAFDATTILPLDAAAACLVGRLWLEGPQAGPRVVALRVDGVYDISMLAPTMSDLFDLDEPASRVRECQGTRLCTIATAVAASFVGRGTHNQFLAPCDLQAIKAAGVTFADSLIERVIEERVKGDPRAAEAARRDLTSRVGASLSAVRPGSPEAAKVKGVLVREGLWSQYLEVGIGPDAEIFTKAQPMSAVGLGAQVGILRRSSWNNPEPELVLACDCRGRIVGATLGNDVNLRDFEGRSALLLSKAKDNNASCAIGPFVRLFDDTFSLDDVRSAEVTLTVSGLDNFILEGASSMRRISRDPLELVGQTFGEDHQYPDGAMLFLGTLFAPTQDRDVAGQGFTHKVGDCTQVHTPRLGTLVNYVTTSDAAPPWNFGVRALMRSLAARETI